MAMMMGMDSLETSTHLRDEIYVLKQGNILGPFTRERVRGALDSGELNPEDFAQTGGLAIWQPVIRVLGDYEYELRGAIAPDWRSLLHWAWLRLRYDIDENSENAGLFCLGVGLVVLALSHWTFLFWLPWVGAALLASVALLQRRRFIAGILLLIAVILMPLGVFIWHAKLKPAGPLPFQSPKTESPTAPPPVEESPGAAEESESALPPPAKPNEPESPKPAPSIRVTPRA
jgi:hypothetical protein